MNALVAVLDDEWASDQDVVDAAIGLSEIGVEFHERCTRVFADVLREGEVGLSPARDAAEGLCSLGRHDLVAEVLAGRVADPRLDRWDRIRLVEVLADLGSHHRASALPHLTAMAGEAGLLPFDLWRIGSALADAGAPDAAPQVLRRVFSHPDALPNHKMWAAIALADLGPAYASEAIRGLRTVVEHPATSSHDSATARARLAEFGEPHRGESIAALRATVADPAAGARERCAAAQELVRVVPGFADEIAEALTAIAAGTAAFPDRVLAWNVLDRLGTRDSSRAVAEFRDALELPTDTPSALLGVNIQRFYTAVGHGDAAFEAWQRLALDRSAQRVARRNAVRELSRAGKRFAPAALDALGALVRDAAFLDDDLLWMVHGFQHRGAHHRARIADLFVGVLALPGATADTVCALAEVFVELGRATAPEVVSALRDVAADEKERLRCRFNAARLLDRAVPGGAAEIVDPLLNAIGEGIWAWELLVLDLVNRGADVSEPLRRRLAEGTVDEVRAVARTAAEAYPALRESAITTARSVAADPFVPGLTRAKILISLVDLDAAARREAADLLLALLRDEREPVTGRAEAARELIRLGGPYGEAVAALRRFATDPSCTAGSARRRCSGSPTRR
ncbi:hypothetical protein ACFQV2_07375 [Actinokineospora soli]|uniref:HEAT repeat-containing protein n=1 Tax=Actinokineospora soli TaxID=1048753 RepID=A0ABW2TJ57_9PSEU